MVRALGKAYAQYKPMPIYLQFSAGCDSVAIFFAMLALKETHPFECVTYVYNQPNTFFKRVEGITTQYGVPLHKVVLTNDDIFANEKYLLANGYRGKVLIDCLCGLLAVAKAFPNSIMVNGGGGDTLYGSLRYIFSFREDYTDKAKFDAKRAELLAVPDPSGLVSLRKLLAMYGSELIAPFRDSGVIDFFMRKSIEECGGDKKTLFKEQFAEDLQNTPYKVFRMSQQIESGIRDLRLNRPRNDMISLL